MIDARRRSKRYAYHCAEMRIRAPAHAEREISNVPRDRESDIGIAAPDIFVPSPRIGLQGCND
jgi:hypothetical protein